jgi:hypothetical protein
MALPKIEYPIFDVHLKSLNKKVKFRPFLVKEEKLLLMAKEAEDITTLLDTVKQIINNCCLEELDVDNLPIFDIEMVFIHLRLRSVGESLELIYKCENVVNEETCGGNMVFEVDLNKVEIKEPKEHTNKIMITESVGVCMKYPSLKITSSLAAQIESLENILDLIYEHLDYVFDEQSKYDAASIVKEELYEFLGSMSIEQLEPFKQFFITMPYVQTEKNVTCNKCGYNHNIVVRGIDDFFG